MYEETTEYSLKRIGTEEIFPSTFGSEYEANKFRYRYTIDKNNWQIVQRKVRTYEWEELE